MQTATLPNLVSCCRYACLGGLWTGRLTAAMKRSTAVSKRKAVSDGSQDTPAKKEKKENKQDVADRATEALSLQKIPKIADIDAKFTKAEGVRVNTEQVSVIDGIQTRDISESQRSDLYEKVSHESQFACSYVPEKALS